MARAGGLVLLVSLWLPWFRRSLSAGGALLAVDLTESGWSALGWWGAAVVAVVAVAAGVWSGRAGAPLAGAWVVAGGAVALIVTVGATTARMGPGHGGGEGLVVTASPGYGLLMAYAGGTAVMLAGVAALLAYARERARSA